MAPQKDQLIDFNENHIVFILPRIRRAINSIMLTFTCCARFGCFIDYYSAVNINYLLLHVRPNCNRAIMSIDFSPLCRCKSVTNANPCQCVWYHVMIFRKLIYQRTHTHTERDRQMPARTLSEAHMMIERYMQTLTLTQALIHSLAFIHTLTNDYDVILGRVTWDLILSKESRNVWIYAFSTHVELNPFQELPQLWTRFNLWIQGFENFFASLFGAVFGWTTFNGLRSVSSINFN